MYRLLLIRHAKSSWDYPQLVDHDRPLNKRGKKDAPRMAQWLKQQNESIDIIYSSSAVRALELAKAIGRAMGVMVTSGGELYTQSGFYVFCVYSLCRIG